MSLALLLTISRARRIRRAALALDRDTVSTFAWAGMILALSRSRGTRRRLRATAWHSLAASFPRRAARSRETAAGRSPQRRHARPDAGRPHPAALRGPASALAVPAVALPRSIRGRVRLGSLGTALGLSALVAVAATSAVFLPRLLDGSAPIQAMTVPGLVAGSVMRQPVEPARAVPAKPSQDPVVAKPAQEPAPARVTIRPTEPYKVIWPYDIVDGLTFGPEGATKTRLAGLEGPPRDAVCLDRDDRPWACGLRARAALNNATRRQNLTCEPVAGSGPEPIVAQCQGAVDVARELVLAGFARPTGRNPVLEEAEDDARQAERGLWNGGWTVRIPSR